VSQVLIGVVDSVMIGSVGAAPLAASAFTSGVFTLFMIVGMGLLLPVSVLVARARPGDGGAAAWLRHGVLLGGGVSLMGTAGLLALIPFFPRFGQPAEVLAELQPFYVLVSLSLAPTLLHYVLRQYAEARGEPWLPMVISLAGIPLNAALNWLLIFGKLGFPALGLTGAGLATLIARCAMLMALALLLRHRHGREPDMPRGARAWLMRPEKARVREFLRLGLPSAGQLLCEVCAFSGAAIMMGWLGTTSLAAHQVALSTCTITFMFPLGLASAASIRISSALPEGDRAHLRRIGLNAVILAWCAMGASATCFILAGRQISALYIDDPEVIALATRLLVVAGLFQLFDGTQVVCAGALRGLSDVKIPTLVTGVAYWVLAMPISYLVGVLWLGPEGIWAGLAAGLAFAALTLGWRLLSHTAPGKAAE